MKIASKLTLLIWLVFVAIGLAQNETDSGGPSQFIVGGNVVKEKTFPWIASLQREHRGKMRHFCGASLIHPRYLLTAGHCVKYGVLPSRIQMLQYDLDGPRESGAITVVGKRIILHPFYTSRQNDIALIELKEPVNTIKPILLSRPEQNQIERSGSMLKVIGWGYTKEGSGQVSDVLMEVNVPVVDHKTCENSYPGLSRKNICAGYREGKKDSCSGDSGGPLFQNIVLSNGNVEFTQVGIVSYGQGCAKPQYYGVYVRVSSYIDWLSLHIPREESSRYPTRFPTSFPTKIPTKFPTKRPSNLPTSRPTRIMTQRPTRAPTPNFSEMNCTVEQDLKGTERIGTKCQLPFKYKLRTTVKTFHYPPTFGEAIPYRMKWLPESIWRNSDARWCPMAGVKVYSPYYRKYGKENWGVAFCAEVEDISRHDFASSNFTNSTQLEVKVLNTIFSGQNQNFTHSNQTQKEPEVKVLNTIFSYQTQNVTF